MRSLKPTCLVTGGAGFLGSHLCESLLADGFRVVCVDNLITGEKRNISHLLKNTQFSFHQHDIIEELPVKINQELNNLSFVYHLASPASPPQYQMHSIMTLRVNSEGTRRMLEVANNNNAVFLLASTSEIYGDPLQHPQKESYFGNVNPIGIRSCYDESKRFAESMTMEYFRKFKTNVRIVRIFNTYGPRMQETDGRVISNFVTQAIKGRSITIYGDGSQTRSFCFVSDMICGLRLTAEKPGISGEVINIGYPKEHTIKEVAQMIVNLTGIPENSITFLHLPEDDPKKRRPDITKAKKLLKWEPSVELSSGLKQTISYFVKK